MTTNAQSASLDDEQGEAGWESSPPTQANPALDAYEARRCHVCSARNPAFGFGPPLTRRGQELWACGTHRTDVERVVRGKPIRAATPDAQMPLL